MAFVFKCFLLLVAHLVGPTSSCFAVYYFFLNFYFISLAHAMAFTLE